MPFLKYLKWQLTVILVLLIAGYGIDGRDGALAVVIGSAIAALPNAYFTFQAFRFDASREPLRAISALYRGEIGKIILVIVLASLSFKYLELKSPLLLFSAMFVMLIIQSLASAVLAQSLDIPKTDNDATLIERNTRD